MWDILRWIPLIGLVIGFLWFGIPFFIEFYRDMKRMKRSERIIEEVNKRYPGPKNLEQWDKYLAELEEEGFK